MYKGLRAVMYKRFVNQNIWRKFFGHLQMVSYGWKKYKSNIARKSNHSWVLVASSSVMLGSSWDIRYMDFCDVSNVAKAGYVVSIRWYRWVRDAYKIHSVTKCVSFSTFYFLLSIFYFLLSTFYFLLSTFYFLKVKG